MDEIADVLETCGVDGADVALDVLLGLQDRDSRYRSSVIATLETALDPWLEPSVARATGTAGGIGNNWDCSVTGSLNSGDPSWNATAQKLMPTGSTGVGVRGHQKTVEAIKWMAQNHPTGSYYVPAHLERAGPVHARRRNTAVAKELPRAPVDEEESDEGLADEGEP